MTLLSNCIIHAGVKTASPETANNQSGIMNQNRSPLTICGKTERRKDDHQRIYADLQIQNLLENTKQN